MIAVTMRRRRLQWWGRGVGDSGDGDGGDKEEEVVKRKKVVRRQWNSMIQILVVEDLTTKT